MAKKIPYTNAPNTTRPLVCKVETARKFRYNNKTQFRVPIDPQPEKPDMDFTKMMFTWLGKAQAEFENPGNSIYGAMMYHPFCPHGQIGDTLWVRETWRENDEYDGGFEPMYSRNTPRYYYAADWVTPENMGPWRASTCMPRVACRTLLKTTDIKVQRLHDISEEDVLKEGCEYLSYRCAREMDPEFDPEEGIAEFSDYWDFEHPYGTKFCWENNPWVWVIDVERIR